MDEAMIFMAKEVVNENCINRGACGASSSQVCFAQVEIRI